MSAAPGYDSAVQILIPENLYSRQPILLQEVLRNESYTIHMCTTPFNEPFSNALLRTRSPE